MSSTLLSRYNSGFKNLVSSQCYIHLLALPRGCLWQHGLGRVVGKCRDQGSTPYIGGPAGEPASYWK
jgi:hypothetical protein